MSSRLVSVVVTTRNEQEVIRRLLSSLKKQTYKKVEIILVDNNSTDQTVKIAESFKVKTYQFGPERSAQRNFGAKKAAGGYLLFLDADMKLSPNVIRECVKIISDKKIGAIVIPENSVAKNFWEKVKAFERSFYNFSGDIITDAPRFIPKKIFKKVGGYDESITGPEDWDILESIAKLGYKVDRIKSKIYHYERIPSLFILAKKKYYYGLKSYKYLDKRNISLIGPKTIYFLRPVFYKQWKKVFKNPSLSLAMIVMFLVEIFAGGLGYLVGKYKKL